ncbi:hypothetical protein IFM89_011767 [Coptis chinensis]|uniref:CASP-like protein n=1 Tax=Coptis chinensis TaxID=261450 RepID=A0A835MB08_9MAGN|nr:hypothetical protein IFM89_011767 [Coptis chinensis]
MAMGWVWDKIYICTKYWIGLPGWLNSCKFCQMHPSAVVLLSLPVTGLHSFAKTLTFESFNSSLNNSSLICSKEDGWERSLLYENIGREFITVLCLVSGATRWLKTIDKTWFFVIANSVGSLHNLLMLAVDLFGYKYDLKGVRLLTTTLLDMGTIALLSTASGAAASISELGKNGNTHARWNKICDRFGTYCDHGGGALIAAFLGIVFLMALNVLSIIALHKKSKYQSAVAA